MGLLLYKLWLLWHALQSGLKPVVIGPEPVPETPAPPIPIPIQVTTPLPPPGTTAGPGPITKVTWEAFTTLDPALSLVSGGPFNGHQAFVGRVTHKSTHVPGLIRSSSSDIVYAAEGGTHTRNQGIQVLRAPEGSYSWHPVNRDSPANLSELMIFGGKDPESLELVGVCRIHVPGGQMTGFYSPRNRTCTAGYGGGQPVSSNVEVLVLSQYGMQIQAGRGQP